MRNYLCFLLLLALATSCMTKRELVYMQNQKFKENSPTLVPTVHKLYKLQSNDVLSIKVLSLQPEMSELFNITNPTNAFGVADQGSMYLSGYSVDEEGNIELPTLGKLKVSGLTTSETQELIQRNLNKYITNSTVIVKLISFKISVLGEVRNPGYFYIYNEQANLFEGLSLAGDLTQGANRQNIKLIRQTTGGSEVILLDLTAADVVQSPYYYLMPNDVIYVEPRKTQLRRDNLIVLNAVFGAVSTAALLLNFLR